MVQINFASREVNCKIVYYGPGRSGKTTNLEVVHNKAPKDSIGEMVSIATEQDRTLYFDFLPLNLGSVAGMTTKFQLYTVPGQVYYDATRKLVLQGSDGIVFVADSHPDMIQENIDSLNNLIVNLRENGLNIDDIPCVIQWNKRDLPNALTVEQLEEAVNFKKFATTEAIAVTGEGVFPTLKKIASLVIKKLNRRGGAEDGDEASEPSATPQPAGSPEIRKAPPAPPPPKPPPGIKPPAPVRPMVPGAVKPKLPVKNRPGFGSQGVPPAPAASLPPAPPRPGSQPGMPPKPGTQPGIPPRPPMPAAPPRPPMPGGQPTPGGQPMPPRPPMQGGQPMPPRPPMQGGQPMPPRPPMQGSQPMPPRPPMQADQPIPSAPPMRPSGAHPPQAPAMPQAPRPSTPMPQAPRPSTPMPPTPSMSSPQRPGGQHMPPPPMQGGYPQPGMPQRPPQPMQQPPMMQPPQQPSRLGSTPESKSERAAPIPGLIVTKQKSMLPWIIVGVVFIIVIIVVVILLYGKKSAPSPNTGWNDAAAPEYQVADEFVGGFDSDEDPNQRA